MAIKIQGTEMIGDQTTYISLTSAGAVKVPVGTNGQCPGDVVCLVS